jgi:hypothetical protein
MKQYISLGNNCAPRTYISRELNLSKKNGYNTCPFDLCITPFESLYNCIETDFEYFFDDLRLIPWECAENGTVKNAIMNKYNMIFNHEGSSHSHLFKDGKNDDLFYTRNNFEKFKERYSARIDNFRNYITNDYITDITFVIKIENKCNLGVLTHLLKEKYLRNIDIIEIS